MDLYMIWVKQDGFVWLAESWDSDSVSENDRGWDEANAKARDNYGAENIRIIKASVDFDKVLAAFDPATTTLGPMSVEG